MGKIDATQMCLGRYCMVELCFGSHWIHFGWFTWCELTGEERENGMGWYGMGWDGVGWDGVR